MDFRALLQNRNVLIGVIAAAVLVIVLAIVIPIVVSNGGNGSKSAKEAVIKAPLDLLTTANLGKAIEIQALLAREGIQAERRDEGAKSVIFLASYTQSQRDRALLAIVKSGLMDQYVGLEVFDKGDFTSTKQDKKIRLARAINGELSRLIRRIPPIENASVFVSIPDATLFTSMQKPTTATVQLTIPSGIKLERDKIKAIQNLLLGSIQDLKADNIAITDTNGNVYNSMIGFEDKMLDMVEENDRYMKEKVQSQLDRLIGKGNYVVTVSTYLREVPVEKNSVVYDPNSQVALNEQKFVEQLGDQSQDKNKLTNAVSSYIPSAMPQDNSSQANRSYNRSAQETQYGVSKTQIKEYQGTGTMEDISIAVTVEKNSIPLDMSLDEFKELIATAASPKVSAANVEIAFSDNMSPFLAGEKATQLPKPESSGNPWWLLLVVLGGGLALVLVYVDKKSKDEANKNQREIEDLKYYARQQADQIEQFNQSTNMIMAQQQELRETITEDRQRVPVTVAQENYSQGSAQGQVTYQDVSFDEISEAADKYDEESLGDYLKSWIEKED
ncbi:MAG: flagellar M-ring protein FliF C-terminal domain-containing protein [bacterium]